MMNNRNNQGNIFSRILIWLGVHRTIDAHSNTDITDSDDEGTYTESEGSTYSDTSSDSESDSDANSQDSTELLESNTDAYETGSEHSFESVYSNPDAFSESDEESEETSPTSSAPESRYLEDDSFRSIDNAPTDLVRASRYGNAHNLIATATELSARSGSMLIVRVKPYGVVEIECHNHAQLEPSSHSAGLVRADTGSVVVHSTRPSTYGHTTLTSISTAEAQTTSHSSLNTGLKRDVAVQTGEVEAHPCPPTLVHTVSGYIPPLSPPIPPTFHAQQLAYNHAPSRKTPSLDIPPPCLHEQETEKGSNTILSFGSLPDFPEVSSTHSTAQIPAPCSTIGGQAAHNSVWADGIMPPLPTQCDGQSTTSETHVYFHENVLQGTTVFRPTMSFADIAGRRSSADSVDTVCRPLAGTPLPDHATPLCLPLTANPASFGLPPHLQFNARPGTHIECCFPGRSPGTQVPDGDDGTQWHDVDETKTKERVYTPTGVKQESDSSGGGTLYTGMQQYEVTQTALEYPVIEQHAAMPMVMSAQGSLHIHKVSFEGCSCTEEYECVDEKCLSGQQPHNPDPQ